jgi:hypothetical protein
VANFFIAEAVYLAPLVFDSERGDGDLEHKLDACISNLQRLFLLPDVPLPFSAFAALWEQLSATDDFATTPLPPSLVELATAVLRARIPGSLAILDLVGAQIEAARPVTMRFRLPGALQNQMLMPDVLTDCLAIVLTAFCDVPDDVAAWERRDAMVAVVVERFIFAWSPPPHVTIMKPYRAILAMVVGRSIECGWVAPADVARLCTGVCTAFAAAAPGKKVVLCWAALNVILPAWLVGWGESIVLAVPDVDGRVAAFIANGGLCGEYMKVMVGRWIAALPEGEIRTGLERVYDEARDRKANAHCREVVCDLLKYVGIKEGEMGMGDATTHSE